MGYAVLAAAGKSVSLRAYGVERFTQLDDHLLKIQGVFERTISLIDEYLPDELAIEAPFFGKNVQSMLKLGRAQGACIAAALSRQIPVVEYAPKRVKQSVTGKGNATKEQVAYMMKTLLGVEDDTLPMDATDACAIALCHYYSQTALPGRASKSWSAFLKENPDRIK
jgi:crossover junction endodeoxyribonuclease RuvC